MADLFEREILEDASSVLFQQQPLEAKSRFSSLKSAVFQVFHQYYEDSEAREAHNSTTLVSASILISRAIVLTQLMGLLVLTLTDRAVWSDFHWFMQALTLTRFDQIAATLNSLNLFFFFTVGVVCFTCLSLLAMLARAYRSLPPNRFFLRLLFSWAMNYLRGAGFVPSLSVLLAGVKYSIVTKDSMREYWDSNGGELSLGAGGVVAGVGGLLGCLTVFLHIMLVYEQFQSNSNLNLRAKAHALADLIVHAALFLIVAILFLSDLYVSVKLTCVAISVPAAIASTFSLYYLPYYRLLQNLVWPALFNIFILSTAALFLSDVQQRPGVAVAVILFVPPVIVKLTKEMMLMRWEFVCRHYTKDFGALGSHYQVELGTRAMVQRVIEGESQVESQVIEAFNTSTGRFKAKMIYVWETNFYMSVLQDPQVAMIKITKAQLAGSSLEADFRVFCFSKSLEKLHKRFDELEYLTFWYLFQEAKSLDSESCHLLGSFWSELSSNTPRYLSLSKLVGQISMTLRKCIEKNKAALKTYKSSKQALNLLGTLLKDILNDRKGDEYISRAALVHEESENKLFSENGAVILVSGEYKRLGEVLFVSDKAKAILSIRTDSEVVGHSISTFIPDPWSHSHSAYLKRFILYSPSSSVSHSLLHLLTLGGFLVEVDAQIRVSYLHGNAFVIVAFVEREKVREVVMLDPTEKVIGHSEDLPVLAGLKEGRYNGVFIDNLLPGMSATLKKIRVGDKFAYANLRTKARYKFRLLDEQYASQKVRVLYLLSDAAAAAVQLAASLSTIEPQTPIATKRVGFDYTPSLEEPVKSGTWVDDVDPALVRKPREDAEVKVSITSSVASSQFLASSPYSQEDLKRVKNSSFRLKAALMCMVTGIQMCCMVAISGVCCGLVSIAADHEFLADEFQLVLRRGYYSARIATKVGQMQQGRTDTDINTDIQLFEGVFITMKDSIASWHSGPALSYYTENRVPTWDFWESKATLHNRNLFDAIQTYLDHAKSISAGVRPHTADLLYIYRNGLGETFEVLNRTCRLHMETNLSELGKSETSVTVAIWVGQALMLLLYVAVVLPSIGLIAQVHSQAWKRLLSLNRGILLKLRNECHNRLEFHHNREDRIVRPFEPQTQEQRISSFRCKWTGLAVKTSAYILSSSLFLILLWRLLCTPVFDLLFITPTVLAKLEEENMLLQTILFWVRVTQAQEQQWNGTDIDRKLTYPRLWFSPVSALSADVSALKVNLADSLDGCLRWRTDYLITPGTQGDEDVLKLGIHTAISLITVDVDAEEDLARLENDITATQASLQLGIARYVSDTEQLIAERVLLVTFSAVGYSVFSLLLYIFLYIPMVNSFRKQVSEVWKLYRIIPSEDLVEAHHE